MTNLEINLAIIVTCRLIADFVIYLRSRKIQSVIDKLSRENTMPHVFPPDCETAENALLRKRDFYIQEAKAEWRGNEHQKRSLDRANSASIGLVELFPK